MRILGSLMVVAMVSSSARAGDAEEISAALANKDGKAILPLLAESVTIGPILFADAECTKHFAKPVTVTPADRKMLTRCFEPLTLFPVPSQPLAWTAMPGRAMFVTKIEHHRIVAIGPFDPQAADSALPTIDSARITPLLRTSEATRAAIDGAKKQPIYALVKSCVRGKAKVVSRLSVTSGVPAFDKEVAGYLRKTTVPATDIAYEGQPITDACIVWSMGPAKRVKDIVQPVKIEKQGPRGDDNGVEDGVEGGDTDEYGPPPPPPPPPPTPPQNIAPSVLEANRIAGNKLITPDDATKKQIIADGKSRVIGSFKLCIALDGSVTVVTLLKSSGYAAYDEKLQQQMRTWKYKPYLVNGRATPVCTAVTFIFSP
jgi:TonB family protein